MVVEKTAGYHITLGKISWPPTRLSQEVTEITAGDAINKETREPHVGLCLGGGGYLWYNSLRACV